MAAGDDKMAPEIEEHNEFKPKSYKRKKNPKDNNI